MKFKLLFFMVILLGVIWAVSFISDAQDDDTQLYPENSRIIDAQGLIVYAEDPENDQDGEKSGKTRLAFSPKISAKPIVLLENKNLEEIEKLAPPGSGIEVRISGTLTEYKGKNYLLLTRIGVVMSE